MKLTMLGTGHAGVTECYNTCFVLSDGGRHFLVDGGGGNGLIRRLKQAGIRPKDIGDIFVTHRHTDHITGILWMLREFSHAGPPRSPKREVNIYAHDEVITILTTMAELLFPGRDGAGLHENVHFIEVSDGESRTILGRSVTFFDIQSEKAKQFGFCMELGDGRKLTCCSDEPCREHAYPYAEHSAWLLHEAFCLEADAEKYHPHRIKHSTVKDACELAEMLGAENLLLYHTEDQNLADRRRLYTEEGRRYFGGRLFVPDDLEVLEII